MKKTTIIILSVISVLSFSCGNLSKKSQDCNRNALLYNEVRLNHTIQTDKGTDSIWFAKFNYPAFCDSCFRNVLKRNIDVYWSNWDIFKDTSFFKKVITNNEIFGLLNLGRKIVVTDSDIINSDYNHIIQFCERWFLDEITLNFSKEIIKWSPIFRFYKENKDSLTKKYSLKKEFIERRLFDVKINNSDTFTLVFKDVFNKLYVTDPLFYKYQTGTLPLKLYNFIFEKIFAGELKVYDPVFFVDKTVKLLDKKEIEKYRKETKYDAIVFHEDWYLNSRTCQIKKVVKGLGFELTEFIKIKDSNGEIPAEWIKRQRIIFYVPLNHPDK